MRKGRSQSIEFTAKPWDESVLVDDDIVNARHPLGAHGSRRLKSSESE